MKKELVIKEYIKEAIEVEKSGKKLNIKQPGNTKFPENSKTNWTLTRNWRPLFWD